MMLPFAGDPSRRTALATSPETERRCGVHKLVRRAEVPVCSGMYLRHSTRRRRPVPVRLRVLSRGPNRGRGRGREPALIVRRLPGEGTRANGELGTLGVVKTGRTVLRAERVDRRRRRRGARVDVDVELVEGLL